MDAEYRSREELFYRMVKAFGYMQSGCHHVGNSIDAFGTDSAIIVLDTEVVPQAPHSGKNTFGAGGITLSLRGLGSSSSDAPSVIHVTLYFDLMCSISDGGVTVAM